MKIALIQTGKTTDDYVATGFNLYGLRIRKYAGFDIITIPELRNTKNMPVNEQKLKEGKKLLEVLDKDDLLVLLDERGREMRTLEFSEWLKKKSLESNKRLVFAIGGPWGFSDEVYSRAHFKISLSKMTFPHQLVRLLFAEQLYRALTIIKGDPYHHE